MKVKPVILGEKAKQVLLIKTKFPFKGYAMIIHDLNTGVELPSGKNIAVTRRDWNKLKVCAWIQFTDAETVKKLGQQLLEFGEDMGAEND